jgi:hypothetical protein
VVRLDWTGSRMASLTLRTAALRSACGEISLESRSNSKVGCAIAGNELILRLRHEELYIADSLVNLELAYRFGLRCRRD